MALDFSLLHQRLPQSATSRMLGAVPDLLTAFMERRQREQEAADLAQQKAAELEFRRQQEARVQQRQQSQDQWEREKFAQQQRGEAGKNVYDAYQKGGAEGAGIVAQAYGGSISPMKPDPAVDFVREDESDPLGFSVTPEYQAEEQRVKGRHTLQMPGGPAIDLGARKAQAEHFARLRATLGQLPPTDPNRIMAERRLDEAEAADLDNKGTLDYIDDGRRMAQQATLQQERLAAQKKRGGGKPGPAKDKTDDLEVLNRDGTVAGLARVPKEAEDSRKARTILDKAAITAQRLKDHLQTHGRISMLKGNSGEQKVRDTLIGSLIEARVALTGALNLGDVDLAKAQFDTSWRAGGPDAAKAVDEFIRNLEDAYEAQKKSIVSRPAAPGPAPAGRDRLADWEARQR